MACSIIRKDGEIVGVKAPNGKESILFKYLAEKVGTRAAYDVYSFARTKEFTDWFGEKWDTPSDQPTQQASSQSSIFTDENGEPKIVESSRGLEWINKEGDLKLVTGPEFKNFLLAESVAIDEAGQMYDSELESELLDVVSQIAIDAMKLDPTLKETKNQRRFLDPNTDIEGDKGVLAKSVLTLAFEERGEEFLDTALDLYNFWKSTNYDLDAVIAKADSQGLNYLSDYDVQFFFEVYDRWDDKVNPSTGNTTEGYRSKVRKRLTDHGILMTDGVADIVETDDGPQKIYSKSSMEMDPATKLSKEAKEALQGIQFESDTSILAAPRSLPISEVYGYVATAAVGQVNMTGVINKLRDLEPYNPKIAPIIDRLESLPPKKEAAVFSNFSLAYKTFTLIRLSVLQGQRPGEETVITDIFNPNENNTTKAYRSKYKFNSRQAGQKNKRALYQVLEDGSVEVIDSKLQEAKAALSKINTLSKGATPTDPVSRELSDALAEYIWTLGMDYGSSLDITKEALANYFEYGAVTKGVERKGMALFTYFMSGNKKFLGTPLLNKIEEGVDIYAEEGSTVEKVASIAYIFDPKHVGTFISGTNKQFYPLNLPTTLDEIARDFSQERGNDTLGDMMKDPFFNPHGKEGTYTSLLLRALMNDSKFKAVYKTEYLDSIKDDSGNATDYSGLDRQQSLRVRLSKYINNNSKYAMIAVPTQADRGALNFISSLRYSSIGISKEEIIKGFIVQDLARIAQANKDVASGDPSKLIRGYHYKDTVGDKLGSAYTQTQIPGVEDINIVDEVSNRTDSLETISSLIQEYIENPGSLQEGQLDQINRYIDKKVKEVYNTDSNSLGIINKAINDLKLEMDSVGLKTEDLHKGKYGGNKKDFIENFVFDEVVGRLELIKVTRSGFSFSKGIEDFYKRMKLISTPGNKLALQGFSSQDPMYGMMPTYQEITIEDFDFVNQEQADAVADRMKKRLEEAEDPDAEKTSDKYKFGKGMEKTDAQGYISIDMYRGIQQGLGNWDTLDEQAYLNEKSTDRSNPNAGRYVTNEGKYRFIYPIKPYHEEMTLRNGKMVLSMNKNSYTTLTKEVVGGMPLMERMYDAMQSGVHVINPVSATKGAKMNVQDVTKGPLNVEQSVTMNSSKLRLPQILPRKKQEQILQPRQVRKNAISNIQRLADYTVRGNTIKGNELLDAYHSIIQTNIAEDTKKLEASLGLTKMNSLEPGTKEHGEAQLKFLQNLRDFMITQANNSGAPLPQNYKKGLEIIPNGQNGYSYRIPLSFPTMQSKFEQIFLSIFKGNIFNQYIKGKELVQIAEAGGYLVDNQQLELEMYDGKNRAQVKMKRSLVGIPEGMGIAEAMEKFPEKLEAIGYRVPNQGKNSMLPIQVIGFLPDTHEKAIMVPGGVTVQMGADFDIDKMFIIQREDVGNVNVKGDVSKMSRQERDALFYDILDSVLTDSKHLGEVLSPLDDSTLIDLAENELYIEEETNQLNPLVELTMENRNKTGQAMTGVWANFLSGRNVLEGKENKLVVKTGYGVSIKTLDGKNNYSDELGRTRDFNERVTDLNLSTYLSAAVDAANNPIHVAINDNRFTAPVTGYLLTLGVPLTETAYFVNLPEVRNATNRAFIEGNIVGKIEDEIDFIVDSNQLDARTMAKQRAFQKGAFTINSRFLKDEIANKTGYEKETAEQAIETVRMLHNFILYYRAGKELQDLNTLITPDTLDNVNEMSAIIAHIEKETHFFNKSEPIIPGGEFFIQQNLTKGEKEYVYGTSAAYRGILQTALNAAQAAGFINNSRASYLFKERLKLELGIDYFSADQHKFIDRSLFLKMLANEDGPLADLMSEESLKATLLNPNNNVASRLDMLRKNHSKFANNEFIKMLKPNANNNKIGNQIFSVALDNSYQVSPSEKDNITSAFMSLLSTPEVYATDPDNPVQVNAIRGFAKQLVANQLLTQGMHPAPGTYIDLLPIELFTTRILTDVRNPIAVSPVEDFNFQAVRTQSPVFFEGFVQDFIRNFGLVKKGYDRFVPYVARKASAGILTVPESKAPRTSEGALAAYVQTSVNGSPQIFVITRQFAGTSETMYVYTKLQHSGYPGRAHEIVTKKESSSSVIETNKGEVKDPAAIGDAKLDQTAKLNALTKGTLPESVEQPLKICKIKS